MCTFHSPYSIRVNDTSAAKPIISEASFLKSGFAIPLLTVVPILIIVIIMVIFVFKRRYNLDNQRSFSISFNKSKKIGKKAIYYDTLDSKSSTLSCVKQNQISTEDDVTPSIAVKLRDNTGNRKRDNGNRDKNVANF